MKWVKYKDSLCSIITWYQNCYKLVTMVTVFLFQINRWLYDLSLDDNARGAHWNSKAMTSKGRYNRHKKSRHEEINISTMLPQKTL